MNCRGVSRRLSAFIDNDLSPGIRKAVEEHLERCVLCKRWYSDLETIIMAARNLSPLSISEGFTERIIQVVNARREEREFLGNLRYKLTLAGVAFTGAAAVIFFLVGPPSSSIQRTMRGVADKPTVATPVTPDFYSNPEVKVKSFPVPEGAGLREFSRNDSLNVSDSTSRIDEFVLPEVQKVREKVNVKF